MRGLVSYKAPPRQRPKMVKRNEEPKLPAPFDQGAEARLPREVQEMRRQMRQEAMQKYIEFMKGKDGGRAAN